VALGVDHTYDQVLQGKATRKMIPQLIGEGQVLELEVDEERREVIEREWKKMTGDKVNLEEHIRELKNEYLEKQADEILQKLLRFRCSRRLWDNMDLYGKDEEKETPGTRRKGVTTSLG
jgi:hypothetical protein